VVGMTMSGVTAAAWPNSLILFQKNYNQHTMKSKSAIPEVFYVILLLLLFVIAVSLLVLAVDFKSFKADFHKAYFPDINYNDMGCLGCDFGYGNPMGGDQSSEVDNEFLNLENAQWATGATASSSYSSYGVGGAWSAMMATGKPDVYFYGDNGNAWAPQSMVGSTETLTLTFDTPVYATGVNIKESYGSGAIVKVEIGDGTTLHKVWEGQDPTRGMNYLKIAIDKTSYKVDTVKITFDVSKKSPNEWSEIDTVQLVGE